MVKKEGMKILITGASGFIGSFLCEEGLKRGMETWAGMREHSSRRWLQQERLNFAFLDLTDADRLRTQLAKYKEKVGRWDVIVHAAGATKCLHREDFFLHNYDCTRNLVNTLDELDMLPEQFLYVSSLSVLGPIGEKMNADGTYNDMTADDTPQPNTAYGESKVRSEQFLAEKRIKTRLCLEEIVKAENIEISDEKLGEELDKMAEQYQMKREDLDKAMSDFGKEQMKKDMAVQEAITFLVDNAVEVE